MATMEMSLPNTLREFVDDQVARGGYRTPGEYVLELIRREQERQQLLGQLLDGARAALTGDADAAYFEKLRERATL